METRVRMMFGLIAATAIALLGTGAHAEDYTAPPGLGYELFSKVAGVPDFIPGAGTLYVRPETMPTGPYLAYDRDGVLVSTIYMIPTADFAALKSLRDLETGSPNVVSVEIYPNDPHPGVEAPHYHIVLWHMPRSDAKLD